MVIIVVAVSLPTTNSVSEGDERVEICIALNATTERNVTITLKTDDDTGL